MSTTDAGSSSTTATGLNQVDVSRPGILRRRQGKGFRYLHASGKPVRAQHTLDRIRALVLPPAWEDVWISPDPRGHIQAVGTDVRGRRQYRYHDDWRTERDQEKHDRAIELAKVLPLLREQVTADLLRDDMGRDRVAAAAMRMLEQGLFRVGGERYVEENTSYGLATLRKEHVTFEDGRMVFDYPAKSGQRRHITIDDPELLPVITTLKRRRTGPDELLAYRRSGSRGGSGRSGGWCDVRSSDINDYLQSVIGGDFSSKDVRTWLGTVLAALALAAEGPPAGQSEPTSESATKRRVAHAVKQVANQLGNTPAVARRAYVDPRVIDQFEDGTTLDLDKIDDATDLATIESAVIDLIEDA